MPDPLSDPRQNGFGLVAFPVVQHQIISPRAPVGADLAFKGLFAGVRPPVFDDLLHLDGSESADVAEIVRVLLVAAHVVLQLRLALEVLPADLAAERDFAAHHIIAHLVLLDVLVVGGFDPGAIAAQAVVALLQRVGFDAVADVVARVLLHPALPLVDDQMGLELVLARADVAALVARVDFADLVERLDVAVERGFVGEDDLAVGAFKMVPGHVEIVKARLDEKLVGAGRGAEGRQRLHLRRGCGSGCGCRSGADGGKPDAAAAAAG